MQQVFTDDQGAARIDLPSCDTIYTMQTLLADVPTLIKDVNDPYHRFEISLKPSLAEDSFSGIVLKIENDSTLGCAPNYLFDFADIQFIREGNSL